MTAARDRIQVVFDVETEQELADELRRRQAARAGVIAVPWNLLNKSEQKAWLERARDVIDLGQAAW